VLPILFFSLLAVGEASRRDAAPPRFGAEAQLVVVSATAVDGKGRPVRDLRPEEVQVLERGRPQKIVHFTHARVTSARILLVIDASGSMEGSRKVANVRAAVDQILATLDPEDQVALAGFDHKYWGVVKFTRDRAAIQTGLEDLTPFGSTALHDALDHAAHDIASHGEGRRAVIVVTDGIDTASKTTPDEVIARSQALDVPIYTLSIVSALDDPRAKSFLGHENTSPAMVGSSVLARYAAFSGGASFIVSDLERLREAALQIVSEVKHQYRLGYDPPDGPPGFRSIEVRTKRKGVRVRARSGYLPPS
jgi:Ca-activated chloride channel homolog